MNGFFKCCAVVPTHGIKTHKCNKTNEIFDINNHVNCLTENVIYRITCQKQHCKSFVYIGQTKRRFCDKISEQRSYISQKKLDQVCRDHFNNKAKRL